MTCWEVSTFIDRSYYYHGSYILYHAPPSLPLTTTTTTTPHLPTEDNHSVYEILFDEEFLGGLTLRCSPNRAYRLPASCLLNLSYGKRSQEDRGSQQPNASQSHLKSGTSYASAALSSRGNEGSLYQYDYTGEGYNYQRSSRRSF